MKLKPVWGASVGALLVATALSAGPAAATGSIVELLPPKPVLSIDDGVSRSKDLDRTRGVEILGVKELRPPWAPPANEAPDPSADQDQEQEEPRCKILGADEKRLAEKINNARDRRERRDVNLDRHISAVAAVHSRAMKRQARLHHTPDGQLRSRVTRWRLLGENVGRGGDIDSLHEAFMQSRPHRDTVTDNEFRHVGIGIARDKNQIWVTVLFEAENNPGTTMMLPEGCE